MIDVTQLRAWPYHLEPDGWADGNQPPFDEWWARVEPDMGHLGREVAEQWPYRHWEYSPYAGIPFGELTVREETWPTQRILEKVFVSARNALDADYDYDVFYASKGPTLKPLEPGRRMLESGTWRTSMLILETPSGLVHREGIFPNVRYLLIEGHSRQRCLNALHANARAAATHAVLILTWTES